MCPRSVAQVCVWPQLHVGIVNGSLFRAALHPLPLAVFFFCVNGLSHTQTYGLTYWQTDFGGNTLPLLRKDWQQNTQSGVLCREPHSLLCGFYIEPPFYTSIDSVNTDYSNCFPSNYSHMNVIRLFGPFIVNIIIVTYGSSNSLSVFSIYENQLTTLPDFSCREMRWNSNAELFT